MYHEDIKQITKENTNFREVLYTGKYSQLVVMSLKSGEDIGEEIHEANDQMIFVVKGDGEAVVNDERFGIDEHEVVIIPAGAHHNIINTGEEDLKIYTIYSPSEQEDKLVQPTKN